MIENGDTKVYWCDGNHEDHWMLKKHTEPTEVHRNVFYMPRASTLTLPAGRDVLFVGGAESIDVNARQTGVDWFPEEIPGYADFLKLDNVKGRVDIVISHTCPVEFNEVPDRHCAVLNDPTREILSRVVERFNPSLWYFGHWHAFAQGKYHNIKWTCLHYAPYKNWWIEIA